VVVLEAPDLGIKVFQDFVEGALKIIGEIERLRRTRVFVVFTGMSREIDTGFVEVLYQLLEGASGDLDVVLFSIGGSSDQAYLAGRYLQESVSGRLSFLIPRFAKSAATILACSGDEIVMTRIAELGPIDPLIYMDSVKRYVPAQSVIELFKTLPNMGLPDTLLRELLSKLPVVEIGDHQRLVEHNIELTAKLLTKRMFRGEIERAVDVARKLASFKQHTTPITVYDAEEIGLRVVRADRELEKLLVNLHLLWKSTVLWYEETTLTGGEDPVEVRIGDRGVFFTRAILSSKT